MTWLAEMAVAAGNLHRRLLAVAFGMLGPERAYALMALLARRFYRVADAAREYGESRCRAALVGRPESDISSIAEQAFIHRTWNLVDLMLASRLLREKTYSRYGGRIPDDYLTPLLEAQRRRQPVILVTAYYGPYDLLPVFLGLNGIHATAIYRPHPNRNYDRFRQSVRGGTGCRMLPYSGAAAALSDALERGETIAVLADHAAGRTGVPLSFLGQETTTPRTIGLLAERYGAMVAATAIRRRGPFRFELLLSDLFGPSDWQRAPDPVLYVTQRYTAALEKLILEQPEQYLWLHSRGTVSGAPAAGHLSAVNNGAATQIAPETEKGI